MAQITRDNLTLSCDQIGTDQVQCSVSHGTYRQDAPAVLEIGHARKLWSMFAKDGATTEFYAYMIRRNRRLFRNELIAQ